MGILLQKQFRRNNTPSKSAIAILLKRFEEIGTVQDGRQRGYHLNGHSPENIAATSKIISSSSNTAVAN